MASFLGDAWYGAYGKLFPLVGLISNCRIRANFSGPFKYDFRAQNDTRTIKEATEVDWSNSFEGSSNSGEPASKERTNFAATTEMNDAPDAHDEHDSGSNSGDVGSDVAESSGPNGPRGS